MRTSTRRSATNLATTSRPGRGKWCCIPHRESGPGATRAYRSGGGHLGWESGPRGSHPRCVGDGSIAGARIPRAERRGRRRGGRGGSAARVDGRWAPSRGDGGVDRFRRGARRLGPLGGGRGREEPGMAVHSKPALGRMRRSEPGQSNFFAQSKKNHPLTLAAPGAAAYTYEPAAIRRSPEGEGRESRSGFGPAGASAPTL